MPVSVSFRDPHGCVVRSGDSVFRLLTRDGYEEFRAAMDSPVAQSLVDSGRLVRSEQVEPERVVLEGQAPTELASRCEFALEHERISFPSYPSEWSPGMLYAAGNLTISIAEALLPEGLGLKDGTPYNVLFRGPWPVFVDVLSIERRNPLDPIWLPYAQFLRTFCLPLLVNKLLGVPLSAIFLSHRDGLEPEESYAWLSGLQTLRPSVLRSVSLPVWLGKLRPLSSARVYSSHAMRDPELARFVLERRLRSARRLLARFRPDPKRRSRWSGYELNNTYKSDESSAKAELVRSVVAGLDRPKVLDVGCNSGAFSVTAARAGAREVVAIDLDPVVIDRVLERAQAEDLPILPLVVNLAQPTPAAGWRNAEAASFLARAAGHFDCVLALAVLHHVVITERVPLSEFFEVLNQITTNLAVVEFVAREDEMFQALLRGRDELHRDFTPELFEASAERRFRILERKPVSPTRTLYILRKRGVA